MSEVAPFLKALIDERTRLGVQKYGQALHTHNGREPLIDALQESLDMTQYITQALLEAYESKYGRLPTVEEVCYPQPRPKDPKVGAP